MTFLQCGLKIEYEDGRYKEINPISSFINVQGNRLYGILSINTCSAILPLLIINNAIMKLKLVKYQKQIYIHAYFKFILNTELAFFSGINR